MFVCVAGTYNSYYKTYDSISLYICICMYEYIFPYTHIFICICMYVYLPSTTTHTLVKFQNKVREWGRVFVFM